MGETVIEKIIRNNVGKTVKPGDIVTVNVDRVMIHDIFIPFVAEKFEEMGFTKLWDPDKAVLIYDHLVPASQLDDTRHFHAGDAFARKYGMKNVHRSDGICHQLMTEAGYVKPGNIVFGTDSCFRFHCKSDNFHGSLNSDCFIVVICQPPKSWSLMITILLCFFDSIQ